MSEPTDSPEPEGRFTQAYFSNAFEILTTRLTQSQNQVISCVGAACPPGWFKLMLACRRRGLDVTLIVPAIALNTQSGLAWERLTAMGGQLVWLEASNTSIQTSACVIDQSVAISGNFDDLKSLAEPIFSGIVIQTQPQAVAACLEGLNRLLQASAGAVDRQLGAQREPSPLSNQLIPSANPAAQVVDWQLGLLAEHGIALDEEIADMRQKISAFDSQQDHAIGDLLREFLDLKQRYMAQLYQQFGGEQKHAQAQAAQADYAQFQSRESTQTPPPAAEPPDPQQHEQIKTLYRQLVMLCHPDRVHEQHKLQAHELFQRVQTSYRNFDFSALKNIEQQLQQTPVGGHSTAPGSSVSLAQRLADLQERLASRYAARRLILQNPTWRTLSTQSNWGLWFSQQANYLQAEVQRYNEALEAAAQPAPCAPH
jgi:hypothetical protein